MQKISPQSKKPVMICKNTGKRTEFDSVKQMARSYNISPTAINAWCNGGTPKNKDFRPYKYEWA